MGDQLSLALPCREPRQTKRSSRAQVSMGATQQIGKLVASDTGNVQETCNGTHHTRGVDLQGPYNKHEYAPTRTGTLHRLLEGRSRSLHLEYPLPPPPYHNNTLSRPKSGHVTSSGTRTDKSTRLILSGASQAATAHALRERRATIPRASLSTSDVLRLLPINAQVQ